LDKYGILEKYKYKIITSKEKPKWQEA